MMQFMLSHPILLFVCIIITAMFVIPIALLTIFVAINVAITFSSFVIIEGETHDFIILCNHYSLQNSKASLFFFSIISNNWIDYTRLHYVFYCNNHSYGRGITDSIVLCYIFFLQDSQKQVI